MIQEPMFIPAQVGRAGEDVALQIEAAIIGGKILTGERLPSERKLQEQFQTGRGVIREAIRALKQKGLIEIKKGARGGAYIRQLDVSNVSESLALFLQQHRIDSDHLAEFRESIDRTITILAVSRSSPVEKQLLLEETISLQTAAGQPEPDLALLGEMDRGLNIQLAKMSGNPVFEWIMNAIQLGFSSNDYSLYEEATYRKKTVDNWFATAKYIADNEPLKALASISRHYTYLRQCLQNNNPQDDRAPDEEFWQNNTIENVEEQQ